jgi:hypothetical protein
MIVDYESVKDQPKTLRARTSLDPSALEEWCSVVDEVWNEQTHQPETDPAPGGQQPILKTTPDRLFFSLFYLHV